MSVQKVVIEKEFQQNSKNSRSCREYHVLSLFRGLKTIAAVAVLNYSLVTFFGAQK